VFDRITLYEGRVQGTPHADWPRTMTSSDDVTGCRSRDPRTVSILLYALLWMWLDATLFVALRPKSITPVSPFLSLASP